MALIHVQRMLCGARMKMILLLAVLALSGLSALPFAVSSSIAELGGTCSPNVITHSGEALVLNISDIGGTAATNLLVIPDIMGATTNQSAATLGVRPHSNALIGFPLKNLSAGGTYPAGFMIQYYIYGDPVPYYSYIACLYSINRSTASQLNIINAETTGSGSTRNMSATLYNSGASPVNATFGVFAPVGFVINGTPVQVALRPRAAHTATFGLSTNDAAQNGTFALWLYATYVLNGTAHASLVPLEVQSMPSVQQGGLPLVPTFTFVMVVLFVALAGLSLRRRGKAAHHSTHHNTDHSAHHDANAIAHHDTDHDVHHGAHHDTDHSAHQGTHNS